MEFDILFYFFILAMFYAVIFGNLTAIIQRLYSRTARYHRDVRVVNEFIAMHDMPESLQGNLREYFTNEQAAIRGDDIESVRQKPISTSIEVKRVKWWWGWSKKTRMKTRVVIVFGRTLHIHFRLMNGRVFFAREKSIFEFQKLSLSRRAKCTTFLMKTSFICIRTKNHFQINSFALGLAFKQRLKATR